MKCPSPGGQGPNLNSSTYADIRMRGWPAKTAGLHPAGPGPANWIFQVVRSRSFRGSVILTAYRDFSDWGQVIADNLQLDGAGLNGRDCP